MANNCTISFEATLVTKWILPIKMKIIAIIAALVVVASEAYVMIYTDSKGVIDTFNELLNNHLQFNYSRDNSKYLYDKLWQVLFDIIRRLNIRVILRKVKAHHTNKRNNEADAFAKNALTLSRKINVVVSGLSNVNPVQDNIQIESSIHQHVQDVT